ncbi:MAG: hypothetical protein H5T96_09070 [Tissierellales bacterium]|nr:hypothetical protein [Tissierellales bacterium]
MGCSNCFNGCSDIKSDQCVKYTGDDVSSLGISNGDSLSSIITQLTSYLVDAIDGSGITPDVSDTCALIAGYLGAGTTLNDFISALIQAACDLQGQIDSIDSTLTTLNADYDVDCLSGVTDSSDTHDVLQAVITKLCATEDTLSALSTTVSTNYVKLADLNSLITSYLSSSSLTSLMSSRMVPYAVVPFFAPDSYMVGKFDGTGAGIGAWANIYLCNGRNGTPDMRGRVPVGVVTDMNGGTLHTNVDPINGNPDYSLNDVQGENSVKLTSVNQIPSHTHAATVTLNDPTHYHYTTANVAYNQTLTSSNYLASGAALGGNTSYSLQGQSAVASIGKTNSVSTGITASVSNAYVGGTTAHNNIQPVKACYYIQYRP